MADFLLIINEISDYSKKDIDKGNTPPDIYTICSVIREAFCLSYAIRKQNNLFLFITDKLALFKFEGETLRYLGSDERSQALLLLKALLRIGEKDNTESSKWRKSTPGILYRTFENYNSFIHYFHSSNNKPLSLIFTTITPFDIGFLAHTYDFPKIVKFKSQIDIDKRIFILSQDKSQLLNFLKKIVENVPSMIEEIFLISLRKIKRVEDKILYINFQLDP